MFKTYFLLFLLAHILGDYYLQNGTMADHKNKRYGWLVFHGLLYALPFWLIPLFVRMRPAFLWGLIAATVSHFVIDALKSWPKIRRATKSSRTAGQEEEAEKTGFSLWLQSHREFTRRPIVPILFDQALHLLLLALIAFFLARGERLELRSGFLAMAETAGLPPSALLAWSLALLLAWKPSNLLIFFILKDYESENPQVRRETDIRAGRMIGLLERVIILILVSLGQPAGISLVIAAKTLARFNRIKEDEEFAERYLIGTLLSTLFAIVISLVL